ncbi:MAG: replicative DNA helicase [bacterium]|nr:replicative DNA helicase [bacterium]
MGGQSQSQRGAYFVPPHNLEAERSVLGCCLLDRAALLTVLSLCRPDDFFHPPHRIIFEAIRKLFNENISPDLVSLTNVLMTSGNLEVGGGAESVAGLTNVVPSVRNAEHYSKIVTEKAQLRRLERLGREMAAFAGDGKRPLKEVLDWSSTRFLELLDLRENKSYIDVGSAATEFYKQYSDTYNIKEPPGVKSGFPDLDRMLLGFLPGQLIIIAARPSQGKTALALDITRHAAKEGKKVAFLSLEMSKDELVVRLLCSTGRLDSYKLRQKRLSDKPDSEGLTDWDRINGAMSELGKQKIFIDDSSALTISEIRAKVKGIALENDGLDMVVVDYLQLIDGELGAGDMRVQEVSKISRSLKALARELEVPVIALSQLSRHIERREGHKKVPQLSDLRESGAIEQDADVVLFIHREITEEEEEEGRQYQPDNEQETQLIVAKNRNGAIGKIFLLFLRNYTTFLTLDQPPIQIRNM